MKDWGRSERLRWNEKQKFWMEREGERERASHNMLIRQDNT